MGRRDRRERYEEAAASLRLVRVQWRGGRPTVGDVMWARSVSDLVAAAPAHVALHHLTKWDSFVLGRYSDQGVARVRSEAESRGHAVEILSTDDYTPSYVASAVGSAPLQDEELRVTWLPSFHPEGIVTARRLPERWLVEVRISRESLWYTRFTAAHVVDWDGIQRLPGVDVHTHEVPRDEVSDAEVRLVGLAENPARTNLGGADGIRVHAAARLTDARFDDDGWCPEPGTRVRAAADLTLRLVRECDVAWIQAVARYLQ